VLRPVYARYTGSTSRTPHPAMPFSQQLFLDCIAPVAGTALWFVFSRGWAHAVQGAEVSAQTKKRQARGFFVVPRNALHPHVRGDTIPAIWFAVGIAPDACPRNGATEVKYVKAFHEKAGRSQVGSFVFCFMGKVFFPFDPGRHCRHPSIRTLGERVLSARCKLGVLVSAGAATCSATSLPFRGNGSWARLSTQSPEPGV